jgi:hypothetical protein
MSWPPHLAKLIRGALDDGVATVRSAEPSRLGPLPRGEELAVTRWKECTTSYFNQEGRPTINASCERRLWRLDHRAARHPRGMA